MYIGGGRVVVDGTMSDKWRTAYLARVRALHSVSPTQGFYNAWKANRKRDGPQCTDIRLSQAQKARLGYGRDETVYSCPLSLDAIHARDVFELNNQCFDIRELRKWFGREKERVLDPLTNVVVPDAVRDSVFVERTMILHYHTQVQRENGVRFRPLRERYVLTDGQVDDYSAWDLDGNSVPNAPVPPPPPANHRVVFKEYESGRQRYYYETIDERRTEDIAWKDTDGGEIGESSLLPPSYIVASGSLDTTIRLWNTVNETHSKRLDGHKNRVVSVACSPDGEYIASGSVDKTVRLWNIASGTQVKTMSGHTKSVMSVTFSPDSNVIASGSSDTTVRLWNVDSGEQVKKLSGHKDRVWSVAFSPDGNVIASGSSDGTVRLWNVASGEQVAMTNYGAEVFCIAFSPNGTYIASGLVDKTVRVQNVTSNTQVAYMTGHTDAVWSVPFSPNGTYIASGSDDATVRLWNVADGRQVKQFIGHTDSVQSVAFSPDGEYIVSGSSDHSIRLWRVASGEQVQQMTGHAKDVMSVAFVPLQARKRQRVNAQRKH